MDVIPSSKNQGCKVVRVSTQAYSAVFDERLSSSCRACTITEIAGGNLGSPHMRNRGIVHILASAVFLVGLTATSSRCSAIEEVDMGTDLVVKDRELVVTWNTGGFDHYNIRWTENGGPPRQVERDGDKRFRYLGRFRRGVVYEVAVQGCRSRFLGASQCTGWDARICGTRQYPCRFAP